MPLRPIHPRMRMDSTDMAGCSREADILFSPGSRSREASAWSAERFFGKDD